MSSPPTRTRPFVGERIPPAMVHRVVFPDPEGPTRATISSSATFMSIPSSATTSWSAIG